MFTTHNLLLLATAIVVALIAGLLYSYSCSVNIGLSKLQDGEYIRAMQSINKEIQNPIFFISFLGSAILLVISCIIFYPSIAYSKRFYFLVAAAICYLLGTMAVTIFGNVPLNESLAAFDTSNASTNKLSEHRIAFESKWNKLHLIRTIAACISLVLVLLACLDKTKEI
jgi:uncharacterized membrane protein